MFFELVPPRPRGAAVARKDAGAFRPMLPRTAMPQQAPFVGKRLVAALQAAAVRLRVLGPGVLVARVDRVEPCAAAGVGTFE